MKVFNIYETFIIWKIQNLLNISKIDKISVSSWEMLKMIHKNVIFYT